MTQETIKWLIHSGPLTRNRPLVFAEYCFPVYSIPLGLRSQGDSLFICLSPTGRLEQRWQVTSYVAVHSLRCLAYSSYSKARPVILNLLMLIDIPRAIPRSLGGLSLSVSLLYSVGYRGLTPRSGEGNYPGRGGNRRNHHLGWRQGEGHLWNQLTPYIYPLLASVVGSVSQFFESLAQLLPIQFTDLEDLASKHVLLLTGPLSTVCFLASCFYKFLTFW